MNYRVPMGHVSITPNERDAVLRTLEAGHLSPGPQSVLFEKKFSRYAGGEQGVLMNSGTDALRISLLAMKEFYRWDDTDEVIVPALTFVATVNAVLQAKLKPVFVDVNPVNTPEPYCLDSGYGLAQAITPKTRCILPVHLFGCSAFSERSGLTAHGNTVIRILEDSCESLAAPLYGDIACFSFYVCHLISLGVGGMAVTNNKELADLLRSYANHGRHPSFMGTQRSNAPAQLSTRFSFERDGYSSRLTEMQAAMGLEQLKTIDNRLSRRRDNALQLARLLSGLDLGIPPFPERLTGHSWMMFPIVCGPSLDAHKLCVSLEERGIETRPLMPLLTQPYYKKLFPGEYKKHPVALNASENGFYIGCHEHLSEADIRYVGDVFNDLLKRKELSVA